MKSGWRIGSVFGIPLLLNASWFLILALFTLHFGSSWQQREWGATVAWVAGFVMALLLFASVLLHELGHSLVARSQGITVNSITLFLFGGVAALDQESKTPGQAFQVAIAGPAVSFAICILLTLLRALLPLTAPVATVFDTLAGINLVLALFNMIPGLPLDGGQVVKAAIWKVTGSRLQGIRWATRSGRLLSWAAIVFGVVFYFTSSLRETGWLWIALLGWFGMRNVNAYGSVTDLQQALMRLNAAAAMRHNFYIVDDSLTIQQFVNQYQLEEFRPTALISQEGRYWGLFSPTNSLTGLQQPEQSQWRLQSLRTLMQPLTEILTVAETTPLAQVVEQLDAHQLRQIFVLTPDGNVSGLIDRSDIIRTLSAKLKIPVSEAVLQWIRAEAAYPPQLQLLAIARATRHFCTFVTFP
jgi:Zn-dependent protease